LRSLVCPPRATRDLRSCPTRRSSDLATVHAATTRLPAEKAENVLRYSRTKTQARACMSNLKNIGTALEMYSTDNSGRFPTALAQDRKSTRLNSSHVAISYAVFCLKKK